MRTSAGGGHALGDRAAVGDDANAIAGVKRHLCQCQRRVDSVIELAEAVDARPHQPARVHERPHGLAALDFVQPRDELCATGAGRPAEITKLVALAIVTQALERTAGTASAGGAPLELDLPAANEIERL